MALFFSTINILCKGLMFTSNTKIRFANTVKSTIQCSKIEINQITAFYDSFALKSPYNPAISPEKPKRTTNPAEPTDDRLATFSRIHRSYFSNRFCRWQSILLQVHPPPKKKTVDVGGAGGRAQRLQCNVFFMIGCALSNVTYVGTRMCHTGGTRAEFWAVSVLGRRDNAY